MEEQQPTTSDKNLPWERELIRDLVFKIHKDISEERKRKTIVRSLKVIAFIAFIIMVTVASSVQDDAPWAQAEAKAPHTAYINIYGEISADASTSADKLIPAIQKAFENDHAKALILRINSPGGSPVQAGQIYEEVQKQKGLHPEKKVYAVIDDIGASGGYYIASSADDIYADQASLVGSIGVITSGFGFPDLMKKIGIERRVLTAGENKSLLDPYLPLDKKTKAFWENVLTKTHEQFIDRVKQGRGNRLLNDPSLFTGLIWTGEQAVELGLIDGIGNIHSVSREIVGEADLVNYSPRKGFLGQLSSQVKSGVKWALHETMMMELR